MKVILLKDVPKIGKKYEVKDVSDGYGLNFLVPKGLAEVASQSSLKKVEILKDAEAIERKIQEDLLLKNIESLENTVITLDEVSNEKGHLFAGIHKEELTKALKESAHLDVPSEYIQLDKPIKEVGEYTVEVKIHDKTAGFKLVVNGIEK